ncbi:MAG: glycosyltransferase family 4 protein [Rhodothermales bacterium]
MEINKPADIVFALTGDVRRNSRAIRQLRALGDRGLRIIVLSVAAQDAVPLEIANAELRLIEPPPGSGPSFFRGVHRLVARSAEQIPAHVYHASDLYVLPALSSAARKHRAKLAYDARELYPHVASTVGRPWVRYFWRTVEGRFIKRADAVFSVSESIAEKLVDMYGIRRPTVIYNIPEAREVSPTNALRERAGLQLDDLVVLHQGQMRPNRGCEKLVDAMRDVDTAVLVFLGDGPLKELLAALARGLGIRDRIRFIEPVPPDELLSYTASADVGVTLLEDVCLNHRFALPNKLFEYLVAGIPVVASDIPEVRRIVLGFDVGLVVDPQNREDLVAALRQSTIDKTLREKWRRNIPKVLETFNSERTSQDFLRVYDDLLLTTR